MTDRAHLEFALALHRVLAPNPADNACWSPFSVGSALGLVARGAWGVTRDELLGLLAGDKTADVADLLATHGAAGRLEPAKDKQDEPVIAVTDTLWADESITIRQSFADELERMPGGAVRSAPFGTSPGKARSLINEDVAETTRGLIPELLPDGVIRADTVAALVNALYLKVAWVHRFAEGGTKPAPFHTPGGAVDVPTMRLTETVGYAAVGGWQVVELPAVGGVQAVVLLPDGDLAEAETAVDADTLGTLLAAPTKVKVDLRLPRLEVRTQAELTGALNALGVRTMFTREADLSGISEDDRLAVQSVLHESVLKIDEQGLEGAAATAVMMRLLSVDVTKPVPVHVDRPFLLLVRHAATGSIYFLSRVADPS